MSGHSLAYAFLPSPNPIRASHTIDLQVLVTSPPGGIVVTHGRIDIPAGVSKAEFLSAKPLPQPSYDASIPWKIAPGSGGVEITPTGTGRLDGTIAFSIAGIEVESDEGVVEIAVTETLGGVAQPRDANAYQLVKQPADFPIAGFSADPPVLHDVDLPVTLRWEAADPAASYGYDIQPANPDRPGPFDANDGKKGVPTAALKHDTRFVLEVRKDQTRVGCVALKVRIEAPRLRHCMRDALGASGRISALRWMAGNAGSCSVELRGRPIDTAAPLDTYHAPYPLALSETAGTYQVTVTAHAATDPRIHGRHEFDVTVSDPVAVPFYEPAAVAITPEATLALVATTENDTLGFIDLSAGRLAQEIPLGSPSALAIDRTGYAYVATGGPMLTPVDIRARTAHPGLQLPDSATAVAVTPDGSTALTVCYHQDDSGEEGDSYVLLVDLKAGSSTKLSAGEQPFDCAITPDGKLGLIVSQRSVTVVGLPGGVVEPRTIPIQGGVAPAWAVPPVRTAISPDGTYALVSTYAPPSLVWIDIANRVVSGPPIPLPSDPLSVAISNAGVAVIGLPGSGSLGIACLARRTSPALLTIPGTSPGLAAVAGDGSAVVVTDGVGRVLVL